MNKLNELHNLNQIWQAISMLDSRGTDATVTMAMTIVSIAKDFVQRGEPLEASLLLRCAHNVPKGI